MVDTTVQAGPAFKWATPQAQNLLQVPQVTEDIAINQQSVTTTSIDDVVSTIKDLVNTFVDNQTESTTLSITSTTTGVTLEQNFGNNSTTIGMNVTSIKEMFGSNSTMMDTDGTAFTEILGSNSTVMDFNTVTEMTESAVTTTIGENVNTISEALTRVVDKVEVTSEAVFDTVSEVITSTEDMYSHSEHYADNVEEKTLYIVLGVILGLLILIIIILLIIYKSYKSKSRSSSGAYCVTDLNEISTSNCKSLNEHSFNFA